MSFDPGISVDTTVRDSYFGFYSSKDKDDSGDRDDSRTSSDDQAETVHNLVETSQKRGLHRGFSSESWHPLDNKNVHEFWNIPKISGFHVYIFNNAAVAQ